MPVGPPGSDGCGALASKRSSARGGEPMAREPADTTARPFLVAQSPAPGPSWHVPVFCAGVCALLGVGFPRPLFPATQLPPSDPPPPPPPPPPPHPPPHP